MKKSSLIVTSLFFLTLFVSILGFKGSKSINKFHKLKFPTGATANLLAGYTGASWDNNGSTCAGVYCHGGGYYGGALSTISLLQGNTPVTSYTPGVTYNFEINISAVNVDNLPIPLYGFDAQATTSTTHLNAGVWGAAPLETQITEFDGRFYWEQSNPMTETSSNPHSLTKTIQWTAPPAGTGSVTFYATGMAVNGNGSTNGDNVSNPVNITITEGNPLAVNFLNLNGENNNNHFVLNWTNTNEENTSYYLLQRKLNNADFVTIKKIMPLVGINKNYNCTLLPADNENEEFRICQVDNQSKVLYSNIINLVDYTFSNQLLISNIVYDKIHFVSEIMKQDFTICDMLGRTVKKGKVNADNIDVSDLQNGVYVLIIRTKNSFSNSQVFLKK
jgi:hypothetical protein